MQWSQLLKGNGLMVHSSHSLGEKHCSQGCESREDQSLRNAYFEAHQKVRDEYWKTLKYSLLHAYSINTKNIFLTAQNTQKKKIL